MMKRELLEKDKKNVLLLSLSLLSESKIPESEVVEKQHQLEVDYHNKPESFKCDDSVVGIHYYTMRDNENKTASIFGFQTNEPGTKAVINCCKGKLDTIVMLATKETLGKEADHSNLQYGRCLEKIEADDSDPESHFWKLNLDKEENSVSKVITFDFYINQIRHYLGESCYNGSFPEVYVLEMEDEPSDREVNNYCIWTANLLVKMNRENSLKLYLETNGGFRDTMTILIGTLRAVSAKGIEPECAIYSAYKVGVTSTFKTPFMIYDKKNVYHFFDLVSGLDDFLTSGSSERLIQFFKSRQTELPQTLVKVQRLSRAFSLCQPDDMIQAMKDVAVALQEESRTEACGEQDDLYRYVIDEIRADFGQELLQAGKKEKVDMLLPMMEWALKKGYIQQTITLIAEKMPDIIVKKRILYYNDNNEKESSCIRKDIDSLKLRKAYESYTKAYIFIQQYLCVKYQEENRAKHIRANIGYQNLFVSRQDIREKIAWRKVKATSSAYHDKAFAHGAFIERVLSTSNIPLDKQILYDKKIMKHDVVELMREYYSIKELRNYINHASDSEESEERKSDFIITYSNFENYDDLHSYLQYCIKNFTRAVKRTAGETGDDLAIKPIEESMKRLREEKRNG